MLFSHRLLIDKRHSISRMSKISQTIATMVNTLISQSKTMSPIMLSLWITKMTRRGTKQGLRLSQLFIYLIWEFQNSVVNVGKNCRLFHLGVGCIHVPIFDVVPGRPHHNLSFLPQESLNHLIVSLKSRVSCGTTPIVCLRLDWLKLFTSSPPNMTFPLFTSNILSSSFATVVFPLPELKCFVSLSFSKIQTTPSNKSRCCARFYLERHIPRKAN